MASAEMPGVSINTATSSKKQELLVNGRRKFDEYKKKKAEEKKSGNKTNVLVKRIANDLHAQGIAANGFGLGDGDDNKNFLHSQASVVGTNRLDALPVSEPKKHTDNGAHNNLWLERASDRKSGEATSGAMHRLPMVPEDAQPSRETASTLLKGGSVVKLSEESLDSRLQNAGMSTSKSSSCISDLAGGVQEQLPWMKESKLAEHAMDNDHLMHESEVSANEDSVPIKREKATEVVLDDFLPSQIADNNWIRPPFGTLSQVSMGSLHESSLSVPASKLENDTPVLSSVVSSMNEKVSWGQEKVVSQFKSSVLSNGIKSRDDKERTFPFLQQRKSATSDRGKTETLGPLDQALSTSNPATLATAPSTAGSKGGPLLSSSAYEAVLSDQEKDSKLGNQSEERKKCMNNEDFTSLEQHIDDLTQEKYSLQWALDAARSLAESLSQQNCAVTEDFNSQGAIINQLQADLEKKKEEIAAQSLVLSSLMMERERAQQENNSAVERSQILAGEVIGLEEKVLKLRSSELKLQRALETLKSENDSFRERMSTLEKDKQNMRSMLDALQEDRKLLHSQLQKTLVSESSKASSTKEVRETVCSDASTSTDDLGGGTQGSQTTRPLFERNVADAQLNSPLEFMNEASSSTVISTPHHPVGFSALPAVATLSADDLRSINHIDALITELLSEKKLLLEMVRRECSKASEFEALNVELSKKLETQTQRLELVVAQSMAREGSTLATNSVEMEKQYEDYVDEGDEVVERVLGWIIRLFPGGSSRRQSSKRL